MNVFSRVSSLSSIFVLLASVLVLARCTAAPPRIEPQGGPPKPMARARLDALLAGLNTKDLQQLANVVKEIYDPEAIEKRGGAEKLAERLQGIFKFDEPMRVDEVLDEDETHIIAILNLKNPPRAIRIDIQPKAPHKITLTRFGFPEDLVDSKPVKPFEPWKSLGELAAQAMERAEAPGVGIAVAGESGDPSVGVAGRRKSNEPTMIKPSDRFHVGSVGKSMTSTLIGRLVEMGKLRFDSTLGELLSDLPMREEYKAVTLDQIMRHRGGIPQDQGYNGQTIRRIVGTETDPIKIRENYAKDILGREMIAKPGERFAYSNAGYSLLGHIAERIMRKPYEVLMKELVFEPLGMTTAIVRPDEGVTEVSGHMMRNGVAEPGGLAGPLGILSAPAGNMVMSMGDLAKFGQAHLRGLLGHDGVLKSATIKHLHKPIESKMQGENYACGWDVVPNLDGNEVHSHNGSNGFYVAELFVVPNLKRVYAVMMNVPPSPGEIARRTCEELLQKKANP